jgi:2-acylglycerol O-acyltransferase 2
MQNKCSKGQKTIFFEFPHGIFPMGQFLSASLIEELVPGQMICGLGADIIFKFPIMRQIMAWIGTRPAKRKNITNILNSGYHCAVIPGGIAEMYLVNDKTESIYFTQRQNTVKAAIQEGANIIPVFFFGNSRILKLVGSESHDSWISKLSRKLRISILLFAGRNGLPVPIRHPIHMVAGDVVKVVQSDEPSDEYVNEILQNVIESIKKLYENEKPEWEKRPLEIK